MLKIHLIILSVIFLIINGSYLKEQSFKPQQTNYHFSPFLLTDFSQLRDTLYTMKDHYIEVNLSTDYATLYSRSGVIKQFPISGGTSKIKEGIESREGLYVLQWKSKKQYSVQFDSTVMLKWMSFNSGIGFHALSSNGYYKYLGKKNVSHGCIRMSREDANELYSLIGRGTPVLVHNGESAVQIGFGKLGETYKYYSYNELKNILTTRLNNLYRGQHFLSNNQKILIDDKNVTADGLMIGNSERVPTKQFIVPTNLFVDREIAESDRLAIVLGNKSVTNSGLSFHPQLDSLYARNG
jgi:hypothetical protein